jgi:hypothetical protein
MRSGGARLQHSGQFDQVNHRATVRGRRRGRRPPPAWPCRPTPCHPRSTTRQPDPECDLDYVPNRARHARVEDTVHDELAQLRRHTRRMIIRDFETDRSDAGGRIVRIAGPPVDGGHLTLNLNLMALGLTAVAAICLGIAVYQRNPTASGTVSLRSTLPVVGIWTFVNYMIMAAGTPARGGCGCASATRWWRWSSAPWLTSPGSSPSASTTRRIRAEYSSTARCALRPVRAFAPDLYHDRAWRPAW